MNNGVNEHSFAKTMIKFYTLYNPSMDRYIDKSTNSVEKMFNNFIISNIRTLRDQII